MDVQNQETMSEVPKRVCEKFMEELGLTDIPKNTIENLNKTLLKEKNLTENAIRKALLSNGQEL